MAVGGGDAVAVGDLNEVAVPAVVSGVDDCARVCCIDGDTAPGRQVDASVKGEVPGDGVDAVAVGADDVTGHRARPSRGGDLPRGHPCGCCCGGRRRDRREPCLLLAIPHAGLKVRLGGFAVLDENGELGLQDNLVLFLLGERSRRRIGGRIGGFEGHGRRIRQLLQRVFRSVRSVGSGLRDVLFAERLRVDTSRLIADLARHAELREQRVGRGTVEEEGCRDVGASGAGELRCELASPELRLCGDRRCIRRLRLQLLGEVVLLVEALLRLLPFGTPLNGQRLSLGNTGGELFEKPGDARDFAFFGVHIATSGKHVAPARVVDSPGGFWLADNGARCGDGENRNDRYDSYPGSDADALDETAAGGLGSRRPAAIRVLLHAPRLSLRTDSGVTSVIAVTPVTSVTLATGIRCGYLRRKCCRLSDAVEVSAASKTRGAHRAVRPIRSRQPEASWFGKSAPYPYA